MPLCGRGGTRNQGMGLDTVTMAGTLGDAAEEAALAGLIVRTLNLEIAAAEIDPEAPLYGEGLGLDSIDILEIALAVSQTYDVKLKADDEDNVRIFRSLRCLNRHIQQHRPRPE
jgi:acyl carrier protein